MHVLALVNQKGGCGKTTTAVNLAGALSTSGAKVLLVDLDPQAHATLGLGVAIEDEPSLVDVLRDRVTIQEAVVMGPAGIHLLPANEKLGEFEDVAARLVKPEQILRRRLEDVTATYDFAILDCPPRVDGVLAANALRSADTALLVVESGTFALQGALKAIAVLQDVSATLDRPFHLRAVGTMFDKRMRIARDLAIGMQAQFGALLFDTFIRTSVRLRECAAAGVPVQILDPKSRAAQDFEALASEVREHAEAASREAERSSSAQRASHTRAGSPASAGHRAVRVAAPHSPAMHSPERASTDAHRGSLRVDGTDARARYRSAEAPSTDSSGWAFRAQSQPH